MAALAAQTIVDRWNSYRGTLGYIPALLDGSVTDATIPMIEGLVYPAAMGLTNAIDRVGGPYAPMLQALSNHNVAVLVPGRCLSAACGAWLSTSANQITWQSKIFIAQYAAEAVLGITNNSVNGDVDQVHASVQILGALGLLGRCHLDEAETARLAGELVRDHVGRRHRPVRREQVGQLRLAGREREAAYIDFGTHGTPSFACGQGPGFRNDGRP